MSSVDKSQFRYQQLEHWLADQLAKQRWQAGEKLPSIRALCALQNVSKATVMHAYQRLEARGLIEVRSKAGFYVCAPKLNRVVSASSTVADVAPKPVTVSAVVMDIMSRGAAFDLLPDPQTGETSTGLVTLNRTLGRALRQQGASAHLYYDELSGDALLRQTLVERYRKWGWQSDPDGFCITSGCQQALALALQACCQPGDTVAVESPGFYGVIQLLEQLQLKVLEIPASPDKGLDCAALTQALQRWKIAACVVTPAFATPTGALMDAAARQQLLNLAQQHDFYIIEDDIYGDLGFSFRPDPLIAQDRHERVLLCGSFSKSLSRDTRIGWIYSTRFQAHIQRLKLVLQLANSRSVQQGLAEFIRAGDYDSHLRRYREQLRMQRDQLVKFLQTHWQQATPFHIPQGGVALWVSLPEQTDTLAAYHQALAHGMVITPGALFSAEDRYRHCLRLSFVHPLTRTRQQALSQLQKLLLKSKKIG